MPSLTVEGIILKRSNFGEADRMITVLTKNLGKISVVARGVRKITSRRAGNVELLNLVKIGLFKGKGYTLTEAQSIKTFPKIKSNLTLSTAAFHILELINRLLPENDANFRVYDLVLETLDLLEENPRQIIIRGFEVKLLNLLGFWSLSKLTNVDLNMIGLIQKLETEKLPEIAKEKITDEDGIALERVLRYYLEGVLEGKLKSAQVFKDIKNGTK